MSGDRKQTADEHAKSVPDVIQQAAKRRSADFSYDETVIYGNSDIANETVPISEQRCRAAMRFKPELSKKLSIAASCALDEALAAYNLREYDREYVFGENGKPSFKDHGEILFNISHAGEYAVAAVCLKGTVTSLGVDIERTEHFNDRIIDYAFSQKEKECIMAAEDRLSQACAIWTAKEAYMKCTGVGLKGGILPVIGECGENFSFKEYEAPEGYRLTICCEVKK